MQQFQTSHELLKKQILGAGLDLVYPFPDSYIDGFARFRVVAGNKSIVMQFVGESVRPVVS